MPDQPNNTARAIAQLRATVAKVSGLVATLSQRLMAEDREANEISAEVSSVRSDMDNTVAKFDELKDQLSKGYEEVFAKVDADTANTAHAIREFDRKQNDMIDQINILTEHVSVMADPDRTTEPSGLDPDAGNVGTVVSDTELQARFDARVLQATREVLTGLLAGGIPLDGEVSVNTDPAFVTRQDVSKGSAHVHSVKVDLKLGTEKMREAIQKAIEKAAAMEKTIEESMGAAIDVGSRMRDLHADVPIKLTDEEIEALRKDQPIRDPFKATGRIVRNPVPLDQENVRKVAEQVADELQDRNLNPDAGYEGDTFDAEPL